MVRFCSYTEKEKFQFLDKAYKSGVRNIEMESLGIASMCNRAKIQAAVICAVLLNRMKDDQIVLTKEQLSEFF